MGKDELLCLQCYEHLHKTGFELIADNPVEKTLWGRVDVSAAMSQYYFSRGSLLQTLIHQFKYKSNKGLGVYLGKQMAYSLKNSARFSSIDIIAPLPLFADKEKKRGYNQAALLCEGMASVLNIPVLPNAITRVRYTETQTHKTRMERWQNVEAVFVVKLQEQLTGKNILLVDDVITTGATMEACAAAVLNNVTDARVSIATLAYALAS